MNEKSQEMRNKPLKTYSLDEIKDKYFGKPDTPKREEFENELRLDLLAAPPFAMRGSWFCVFDAV